MSEVNNTNDFEKLMLTIRDSKDMLPISQVADTAYAAKTWLTTYMDGNFTGQDVIELTKLMIERQEKQK